MFGTGNGLGSSKDCKGGETCIGQSSCILAPMPTGVPKLPPKRFAVFVNEDGLYFSGEFFGILSNYLNVAFEFEILARVF
jgi:hypothetical protein